MPVTITIRDVPEDVRDELADRAARAGRSLRGYLREQLQLLAATPDSGGPISWARDALRSYPEVSIDEIVRAVRDGRR